MKPLAYGGGAYSPKGGVAALTIFLYPTAPPKNHEGLWPRTSFQNLGETNRQFSKEDGADGPRPPPDAPAGLIR